MKRKQPMPRYYMKNIERHTERKFFQRKAMEADQEKRQDRPEDAVNRDKREQINTEAWNYAA